MPKTVKFFAADDVRKRIRREILDNGPACSLNHIDVSEMVDFHGVFRDLDFTGDISGWKTGHAKDMNYLFYGSTFKGDISEWDTSKVTHMASMFEKSAFTGDISRWNTSNVQFFSSMFSHSAFNGDISRWNTARAEQMASMFKQSSFDGDVSAWNVARCTSMASMFEGSVFNGSIAHWDVARVTNMASMFDASQFDGNIERWGIGQLTHAAFMFAYSQFNGDISQWKPSPSLDATQMFEGAQFKGDLSSWRLWKTSFDAMFDPTFEGIPPKATPTTQHTLTECYAKMLGGPVKLSAYLRRMPFGPVHFDILLESKKKPAWASAKDHAWVKEQEQLASALGLNQRDFRTHCLASRSHPPLDICAQDLGEMLLSPDQHD